MLIHPTVERLRTLGLTAMADAFVELQNTPEAADLPREDWLGLLIDREVTSRDNRRLARRLREAKLRQAAVIEDTDFRTPRGHVVTPSGQVSLDPDEQVQSVIRLVFAVFERRRSVGGVLRHLVDHAIE